jgi:hypothetical protein
MAKGVWLLALWLILLAFSLSDSPPVSAGVCLFFQGDAFSGGLDLRLVAPG